MQPVEYIRFKKYIEATSRPDVWEKRMRMAPELIERRHDSINSLVTSVKGNSRDKAWISSALAAGEIVRDETGRLHFPKPEAPAPVKALSPFGYVEEEPGTLEWLLDQVWACDSRVSVGYMEMKIEEAWRRAEEMRALGKQWVMNDETGIGHWEDYRP